MEYVCVFGLNNTVIDILKVCTSYIFFIIEFLKQYRVKHGVPGCTRVCTPGTPVYCLCWCTHVVLLYGYYIHVCALVVRSTVYCTSSTRSTSS